MTDINTTNENEVLNFANEGKPSLPTGLNVLTILTFIGSGFSLLVSLVMPWYINLMKGFMDKAAASGQEFTPKQMEDMEKGRKAMELLSSNLTVIMISGIISGALCIYGAIMMRKLKKDGFWLYTAGVILPIATGLIVMGTAQFTGVASVILSVGIPLVFILLYALQLKHLKK